MARKPSFQERLSDADQRIRSVCDARGVPYQVTYTDGAFLVEADGLSERAGVKHRVSLPDAIQKLADRVEAKRPL